MKRSFTAALALFLAAPSFVLAQALTPAQAQIQQLTVLVASLEAQIQALQGAPLTCALVASKQNVQVNEPFFLAWGSVGALAPGSIPRTSMWPQNGVQEITIQRSGTMTYSFDFYGANGATTACSQKIVVTS